MPTVISTAWVGRLPSTKSQLIAKVCALTGFATTDSDLTTQAEQWLDDSIKDLNHNVWQSTIVAESGIPITEGQQWVNISSRYFKESQAYLTHNTNGDAHPLKFLTWVNFKRLYPSTDSTQPARPYCYTIFNEQRDGKIYLYPIPDNDTAVNNTLSVEYYQRLPLISTLSGGESPAIPEEFENVILYGAYKRSAIHMGNPQDVALYAKLEADDLEKIKRIDSMQPDADRRFRLVDEIAPRRGYLQNLIFPY